MKEWVKLDNASNIFLAARSDLDTKVFRLTASLKKDVNPEILQKALDKTLEKFILYSSVLRRGIFWYYLQTSSLKGRVEEEKEIPCSTIYHYDSHELLYRVLYYKNRIHCEFFHALSDGTGALWFFRDLVIHYLTFLHPEHEEAIQKADPFRKKQRYEDSFYNYFYHKKEKDYIKSAQSALKKVQKQVQEFRKPQKRPGPKGKTLHIKGSYAPDLRMSVYELLVPVKKVLPLAREMGVSLTVFLTALFMESTYEIYGDNRKLSISISVPVNLRQFYPSNSARNFFYTARLFYLFEGPVDFHDLCQSLKTQLLDQTRTDYIEDRIYELVAYETFPPARIIPRPIKDLLLKGINAANNKGLTLSMSNIGKVQFPDPIADEIKDISFLTSTVRPQFSMVSYQDKLNITFTSPFMENKIERRFVDKLRERNVEIVMRTNRDKG